jgi:hypothetical protein
MGCKIPFDLTENMVTILNTTLNRLEIRTGMVLECMLIFLMRCYRLPRNLRKICEAFRPVTAEHIAVYGAYNDLRLTGKHETASIHDFSMEF